MVVSFFCCSTYVLRGVAIIPRPSTKADQRLRFGNTALFQYQTTGTAPAPECTSTHQASAKATAPERGFGIRVRWTVMTSAWDSGLTAVEKRIVRIRQQSCPILPLFCLFVLASASACLRGRLAPSRTLCAYTLALAGLSRGHRSHKQRRKMGKGGVLLRGLPSSCRSS